MLDDIKKSFYSTLYERTTSPFFGTLILSWSIWNWKIIYLTLFISQEKILTDKISYIVANFSNNNDLLLYPLISTAVLITIIPFISNGAYWLSVKFDKWKKDQKNIIEKNQLLTLEKSIALREELFEQQAKFEKQIDNKILEIKQLNTIIENYKNHPKKVNEKDERKMNTDQEQETLINLSLRIKANPIELENYNRLLERIQSGYSTEGSVDSKLATMLESFDIIESQGKGIYKFTATGKKFNQLML